MIIVFVILFYLYLGLTLAYAFNPPKATAISPWPQLSIPPDVIRIVHCNDDADCESNHLCLSRMCVPKLLRGGKCDPKKGRWTFFREAFFAFCDCLDSDRFDQHFFGGDCTVNVACGVHGRYNPVLQACDCDAGYKADGLTCRKIPVLEYEALSPCGPDELEVSALSPHRNPFFHADYVANLVPARCVKRPCSFDALSGKPLKHARFEPDWGCTCDPSYGLFGIVLDVPNKRYLKTPGFDACASVFLREPSHPIDVKWLTYFYLGKREPLSLILFENLKEKHLVSLFRGRGGQFIIHQSPWRYDYAQYFFKTHAKFRARTRQVVDLGIFHMIRANNQIYHDDFEPRICSNLVIPKHIPVDQKIAYQILYASPVCRVSEHDSVADPMFKDRTIVNPNQLTLIDHPELPRFNAFVLNYEARPNRWTLDLDYPFKMDYYRQSETNAPRYGP